MHSPKCHITTCNNLNENFKLKQGRDIKKEKKNLKSTKLSNDFKANLVPPGYCNTIKQIFIKFYNNNSVVQHLEKLSTEIKRKL